MNKYYSILFETCFLIFIAYFINSCASLNQSLTPGTKVLKSDFDNSTDILQEPVSAASSLSEAWHTLGFRWNSKAPDIIFITAGVHGITNITGLSFNIDGEIIDLEPRSSLTNYDDWSTRQFSMDLKDFKELAKAQDVKMKVVMIDTYSVSSFGQTKPDATVSGKFSEFLSQVGTFLNK